MPAGASKVALPPLLRTAGDEQSAHVTATCWLPSSITTGPRCSFRARIVMPVGCCLAADHVAETSTAPLTSRFAKLASCVRS